MYAGKSAHHILVLAAACILGGALNPLPADAAPAHSLDQSVPAHTAVAPAHALGQSVPAHTDAVPAHARHQPDALPSPEALDLHLAVPREQLPATAWRHPVTLASLAAVLPPDAQAVDCGAHGDPSVPMAGSARGHSAARDQFRVLSSIGSAVHSGCCSLSLGPR